MDSCLELTLFFKNIYTTEFCQTIKCNIRIKNSKIIIFQNLLNLLYLYYLINFSFQNINSYRYILNLIPKVVRYKKD